MDIIDLYRKSFRGLSREVWLLALVMLINRSGAMVLPFLGIYLNVELGYSLADVGLIMTFFGLGSFLGAFSGGILTDKYGFFNVQVTSLLLTSLTFLNLLYIQDFWGLCAGIFLISFVADHLRPANWTAVEAFSTEENLIRSISLVRLAVNLGYFVGPFVGGVVAGTIGYYMLFVLNASSLLAAGIVFYFLFRHKKKRIEPKEKGTESDERLPWQDWSYLAYLFPFTLLVMVFLQFIYSVPVFLKQDYQFVEFQIGVLMAANGLMIFLIEMPIIYLAEKRYTTQFWIFIGGVFITAAYFCLLIIPVAMAAAICYALMITVGEIISFPFSSTKAIEFSNDKNRGKYMGLYSMSFSMAAIVAPYLGLSLSEHYGFGMLWMICVAVSLISSVWILMLRMPK